MSNQARSELKYKFVKYLWDDEEANKLVGVDRLVYRSNRLGDDLTLTNTGGGNTSSKLPETDPLTGESVEVLWLKGSGGDLRTAKRDGFASLYLEKVKAMRGALREFSGKWSQDAYRRFDVSDVLALRIQLEPAGVLDRYSAAYACPF